MTEYCGETTTKRRARSNTPFSFILHPPPTTHKRIFLNHSRAHSFPLSPSSPSIHPTALISDTHNKTMRFWPGWWVSPIQNTTAHFSARLSLNHHHHQVIKMWWWWWWLFWKETRVDGNGEWVGRESVEWSQRFAGIIKCQGLSFPEVFFCLRPPPSLFQLLLSTQFG